MKFLFFGSPRFAEIVLEKLIVAGFIPEAVIVNPDRPFGRKKILTPPPVKTLAEKHGITVMQPESLSTSYFLDSISDYDFAIVAAYSRILPQRIISAPRLGTIGVHPSLLPKYRGASPIQGALLHGETETGVTLYQMDEKVDHGKIISNRKYKISNLETYLTLEQKLAELAGDLLIETIPRFIAGKIEPQEQNHEEATFTKKFVTQDAFVDPELLKEAETLGGESAIKVYNMIRALNPEPGVWTKQNGKRVKLISWMAG